MQLLNGSAALHFSKASDTMMMGALPLVVICWCRLSLQPTALSLPVLQRLLWRKWMPSCQPDQAPGLQDLQRLRHQLQLQLSRCSYGQDVAFFM